MVSYLSDNRFLCRFLRKARAFLCRGLVAGVLAVFLSVQSLAPARAGCGSCCGIPECQLGSTIVSEIVDTVVGEMIDELSDLVDDFIEEIIDELVRFANQGSNNQQNVTDSLAILNDQTDITNLAPEYAQTRVRNAIRMIPSRTACRIYVRDLEVSKKMINDYLLGPSGVYSQTQRMETDYAANLPGGPTDKGRIFSSQNLVKDIGDGFCDPAVLKPPAGFPCTLVDDSAGKPMAFRYTQPWLALFGVKDGLIPPDTTSPENRAARLFARMAIEPVPVDPLRGAALSRAEGQTLFIRRQSDIAAINLARHALDRMIDDRLGENTPGNESIEFIRQKMWNDSALTIADVKTRAGQPLGANYDDLAPMVGEVNKIYWQVFNNLERLAAIKSVHMARVVQEFKAGASAISARVIQAN
jgi:hypothetical protein